MLEHVLLAQRSLLLPTYWSLFLSIHQTHSPSSFVPLLVRNCDPLEEERHSGFGCVHPFCTVFSPSLWIYLPVVFVVGELRMGSLSGCPFCWWWSISVTCFFFYQSSPFAIRLLRSTPGPACLGYIYSSCGTVRDATSFFFCYLCPMMMPAKCQSFGYRGVRELLEETVCTL